MKQKPDKKKKHITPEKAFSKGKPIPFSVMMKLAVNTTPNKRGKKKTDTS